MSPERPGMTQYRISAAAGPDRIPLGPDHPTLDGLPTIALRVEDGRVRAAEWVPGTVHRGAEKLFESRDYRQILALVDRHDWLSAFCSEVGVAVGIESALGLVPPPRAQRIRILLCELTRIAHHLAFLAPLPGPLPPGWRAATWAWREEVLDLLEQATGHRVHPMFAQVGGVRSDVSGRWLDRVAHAAERWSSAPRTVTPGTRAPGTAALGSTPQDATPPGTAAPASAPPRATAPGSTTPGATTPTATTPGSTTRGALPRLDSAALEDVLGTSYRGVALLTRADALAHGASGAPARASGVDLDLRRDDPYLPYPSFDVPTDTAGDAAARVRLLVGALRASIGLVSWAREELAASTGQPVSVRLPKVLRVPEGTRYTWTENPAGINGYLLVSGNDRTPWRLKVRSAGFGNAAALGRALIGTRPEELPAAIASFGLLCGDIDR